MSRRRPSACWSGPRGSGGRRRGARRRRRSRVVGRLALELLGLLFVVAAQAGLEATDALTYRLAEPGDARRAEQQHDDREDDAHGDRVEVHGDHDVVQSLSLA